MRITSLELFKVPPRWLFLKLTTDEGPAGWGEPIVEGHADTVAAAVQEAGEFLVGQDPANIEDLWQTLYRGRFYRGGPVSMSVIAGIDQALWDLKGKVHNLPIHEFLGGPVRDRIRVYAWIEGGSPVDAAQQARARATAGFTAIKMNATQQLHWIDSHRHVDALLERVAAIREALGPDFDIAIDFHGRVHKSMARIIAHELEQFHPLFIEEPVLPEHNDVLREVAAHTTIPIATGERLYSRWDFKRLLQGGCVDIIQPDPSHAGGISETRRIAAMAEAYDVALAPHCPLGPIALATCLQIDACTPNAVIQEQSLNIQYPLQGELQRYLLDPGVFAYRDGYVPVPRLPGLGIAINEDAVRAAAQDGHDWHNPVWRTADGTIAEW